MKMKMMFLVVALSIALCVPAFAGVDVDASAKAKAEAGSVGVGEVNVISPQQLPNALTIIPNPIPLIQGGRVGDVTAQVVRFAIQGKPYTSDMRVIKVLKIVKGSIFDRTRLEDIEEDFLDAWKGIVDKYASKKFDLTKVAYLVQYKDSAMGAGVGGGGAASLSSLSSSNPFGTTLSGAVLPGYTRSTADPAYFIKFFLVE